MILDETSLLRTVFAKAESVLLDRNLKSYRWLALVSLTYSDQKMIIEILAL